VYDTEAKIARVLLADDHAEFLTHTGKLLAGEFGIVDSVANGLDLIDGLLSRWDRSEPTVIRPRLRLVWSH